MIVNYPWHRADNHRQSLRLYPPIETSAAPLDYLTDTSQNADLQSNGRRHSQPIAGNQNPKLTIPAFF
ncbi:MAG: Uncharacterised protein [SAR92 bacterium MED-G29]|nr:MAG: Uncharacterised protein [SAR92 bacterium MED-G29]